jgi:hypothetical protein
VSGDIFSLNNPAYWLSGLAIFGAGVWVGRAIALRLVPPSNWRQVAGMALIFAGILALPVHSPGESRPAQSQRAAVQQGDAVVSARASVVVAKTSLAAGTALTPDNVDLRDVPADALQPNAATALSDVNGKVLAVPVAAGEQILTPRLQNPSLPLLQGAPAVMTPGEPVDGAWVTSAVISPTNTKVGDTINVKITVKNTSAKPLQTMGPEPGFTYAQGQTYFTQQFASDPGKWRVAIGSAGLDATELPYRWGLGGDLSPGATTTVTGHVKITQDFKTTNFWAALIKEPGTVVQTGVGIARITSLPEELAIVAVDSGALRKDPTPTPAAILPRSLQAGITGINK